MAWITVTDCKNRGKLSVNTDNIAYICDPPEGKEGGCGIAFIDSTDGVLPIVETRQAVLARIQ